MDTEPRALVDGVVKARDRNADGRAANARPRDRLGRPLPYGSPDELGARAEPDDVCATVDDALAVVVELFAQRRFFEAHEFLEFVWKHPDVADADRDFWKGVTQVAVGCAHTQRGNDVGATKLLTRAQEYMAPYPSPYGGVDRNALVAGAQSVLEQVREHGAGEELDFPVFPRAGA